MPVKEEIYDLGAIGIFLSSILDNSKGTSEFHSINFCRWCVNKDIRRIREKISWNGVLYVVDLEKNTLQALSF